MEYIKKAELNFEEVSDQKRKIVEGILNDIETRGEEAVRELAKKFDNWEGDFILSDEKKAELIAQVPQRVKDDIKFAYDQVFGFAKAQRESIVEFESEPLDGVRLGQRVIPMEVAGCYVPGGRFAHACSAIMSVATAKAAGVETVIACSPPRGDSIAPAVVYAMDLAGADIIIEMGGVQAIATMAFGLFTGKAANILVGPGNAFVAEAKAILSGTGRCAIDVFAGPTESSVIADKTADPMTVAIDLVSQAEHGLAPGRALPVEAVAGAGRGEGSEGVARGRRLAAKLERALAAHVALRTAVTSWAVPKKTARRRTASKPASPTSSRSAAVSGR